MRPGHFLQVEVSVTDVAGPDLVTFRRPDL